METNHTQGPWGRIGNSVGVARGEIATVWDFGGRQQKNALLISTAPCLLRDVREAAATLRRYEILHRAKGTADSDAKADANATLAARFEATIAKATGQ